MNRLFLDEPMKFEALQSNNPMVSPVNIRIAYHGVNRNGSNIAKEVLESAALASLPNCPIVGYYEDAMDDFADHAQDVGFDRKTGKTKMVRKTQAYGVVPSDTQVWWENVNGMEYLMCQGYLWTSRYPEVLSVLEGYNNQSMELDPNLTKGEWMKNPGGRGEIFNITETFFSALCILGAHIDPAFEEAKLVSALDYSLSKDKDFEKEWSEFMKDLSFALNEKVLLVEQDDIDVEDLVEEVIVKLDVVADNLASEGLDKPTVALDDIITELLIAEDEKDVEDKVVLTDEVSEALLQQLPEEALELESDEVIIISDPKVGTSVFTTAPSITKGYKEVEEMPEEMKELQEQTAQNEVEKQVAPPAPAKPPVEETNMAVPPVKEEVPAAPAPQQVPAPVEETQMAQDPMQQPQQPGMEQPQVGMEQPGGVVQRENLEEKKKNMELAKFSDEELLQQLMGRISSAERAKQMLAAMAPTQEQPVAPEGPAPTEQPLEETNMAETPEGENAEKKTEEVVKQDGGTPAQAEAAGKEEGAEVDQNVDKSEGNPVAAKEAGAEAEVAKEEKAVADEQAPEKKKEFSIETYQKALAKLKKDFSLKVAELEKANTELEGLKNFKLAIDRKEKENMLNNFSLLGEDFLTNLRTNIDTHSVDELEAKCAVEMVRNGLSFGQKAQKDEVILSFSNEGSNDATNAPSWLSAVDAIRASKKR